MAKFAIYGAGGFGREIVPLALSAADAAGASLVFVDDHCEADRVLDVPVVAFGSLQAGDRYVLAVADPHLRASLDKKCLASGLIPTSIQAETYQQGLGVEIGPGAMLCHYTMVTASATIGRQFHCNSYSYVSHDCVIGDYVTFLPRVCCGGNVHIGDHALIGAGATIKQGQPGRPLRIGRKAIVGMGAVVTRDVQEGEVVAGNPARPLRR